MPQLRHEGGGAVNIEVLCNLFAIAVETTGFTVIALTWRLLCEV